MVILRHNNQPLCGKIVTVQALTPKLTSLFVSLKPRVLGAYSKPEQMGKTGITTFFQSSGSVGQCKYSPWNSARIAQQDLGDEFTDGGLANQPLILQVGVGLLQGVSALLPVSIQLLKLVNDFLMEWCMRFSMRQVASR